MSDWVQDSFGELYGARLSGASEPAWLESNKVIKFSEADTEWLLDLRYRLVTGRENLKADKRNATLKALQQELDSRAAPELFTVDQVRASFRNLLSKVVTELGEMSEAVESSAETRESIYGSDNTYFQYLDEARFLWGLKDYFDRLIAYGLSAEKINGLRSLGQEEAD